MAGERLYLKLLVEFKKYPPYNAGVAGMQNARVKSEL